MIEPKIKPCKAIGKSKGFNGCNKPTKYRTYGLCNSCKAKWMLSTTNGQEYFDKMMAFSKKKYEKKVKDQKRLEKESMKIEIMSVDKYRSTYVQPLINKIARLIDQNNPCIATEKFGKMNGGHYVSVGANRTICLNLHNIFIQSFQSNHWQSGDNLKYQQGLMRVFGEDYLEFVEGLRKHPELHLNKAQLIEIKDKASVIVKSLEKDKRRRNPTERILLRNVVNEELGIYLKEFCSFEKREIS
jgi:hypothetical protein